MTDKKKPLTVEELWKFERVGGISLSPDGAQAVCSVSRYSMEENSSHASLWLLSTFGGAARPLTSCGDKDGQPAWSPTGEQIAFVAKREQQGKKDESAQLYTIAPTAAKRVASASSRPASTRSSGSPTAAASLSSPGSGPSSRARKRRAST